MTDKIKKALHEATVDTFIALPLNFLINWIILLIAFQYHWGATITSVVATIIFTILGITRKTIIRLRFARKHGA
jgi:hypothetical protein